MKEKIMALKNKKYSRKILSKQIKKGKSKYHIVISYNGDCDEELFGNLASIPDPDIKFGYRILHKIASILFIVLTIIVILGNLMSILEIENVTGKVIIENGISILLFVYFMVMILKFHGLFFFGGAVLLGLDIVFALPELITIFEKKLFSIDDIVVLILLGLSLVEIILLIIIKNNVFSYISYKGYNRDKNEEIIFQR